jgi:hypothetical protein
MEKRVAVPHQLCHESVTCAQAYALHVQLAPPSYPEGCYTIICLFHQWFPVAHHLFKAVHLSSYSTLQHLAARNNSVTRSLLAFNHRHISWGVPSMSSGYWVQQLQESCPEAFRLQLPDTETPPPSMRLGEAATCAWTQEWSGKGSTRICDVPLQSTALEY